MHITLLETYISFSQGTFEDDFLFQGEICHCSSLEDANKTLSWDAFQDLFGWLVNGGKYTIHGSHNKGKDKQN